MYTSHLFYFLENHFTENYTECPRKFLNKKMLLIFRISNHCLSFSSFPLSPLKKNSNNQQTSDSYIMSKLPQHSPKIRQIRKIPEILQMTRTRTFLADARSLTSQGRSLTSDSAHRHEIKNVIHVISSFFLAI